MTARVLPFTTRARILIEHVRSLGRLEYRISIRRGEEVSNVWCGDSYLEARRVVADIEGEERARGRRYIVDDRTRRVGDAPL